MLAEHDIAWMEFHVGADAGVCSKMQALARRTNVPTVISGDDILAGPTREQYDDALNRAGVLDPARRAHRRETLDIPVEGFQELFV